MGPIPKVRHLSDFAQARHDQAAQPNQSPRHGAAFKTFAGSQALCNGCLLDSVQKLFTSQAVTFKVQFPVKRIGNISPPCYRNKSGG